MKAAQLLKTRAVWMVPIVLASVAVLLMTLIYFGSIVDPVSHLRGLPVLVVDEDVGASASATGTHTDLGTQVTAALTQSRAVSSRLSLDVTTLTEAKTQLDKGADFAAVIIPATFTTSVLALTGTSHGHSDQAPRIELLTNPRAGTLGVSLATGVLDPALSQVSKSIGQKLLQLEPDGYGSVTPLLADPVTISMITYRPLPPHSGLGLSAFYISLLSTMCGFLGAIIVNSSIDAALGYATTEIGPRWSQRVPVSITRWQTLLAKWVMAVVIAPLLTFVMLVVAAGILKMDSPHLALLWVFTSFVAIVIALGTLVLFAALGTLGQIIALLVFVYLALASSGGTIPLQALSGFYRFTSNFEPMRQILDGVRAILYFGAQGDAGLTRGSVMAAIGLAFWIVLGISVTKIYDRKGLDRMPRDLLDYVRQSATDYTQHNRDG